VHAYQNARKISISILKTKYVIIIIILLIRGGLLRFVLFFINELFFQRAATPKTMVIIIIMCSILCSLVDRRRRTYTVLIIYFSALRYYSRHCRPLSIVKYHILYMKLLPSCAVTRVVYYFDFFLFFHSKPKTRGETTILYCMLLSYCQWSILQYSYGHNY